MSSYLLEQLIQDLEEVIADLPTPLLAAKEKRGEFRYIPLNLEKFIEQVKVAKGLLPRMQQTPSFIDVGCGIGTKVAIAQRLGCTGHGIEITTAYVKAARKLMKRVGRDPARIIQGDARRHSYAPYDLIYFYCPMLKNDLQEALEQRILATARPGALILANNFRRELWGTGPTTRLWEDTIFRKEAQ